MDILFGNLAREYNTLKDEIDNAIHKVLDSGRFLLGEECEKFECSFADYCNVKFCVGVASGTDALALSLMSLNVGRDDLVVTVPNTAIPTVSAISMVGAEPLFVDIDENTMLMDPEKLENLLKQVSKTTLRRIKAIIPVHLYGLMCPMDEITETADKHKIPIVEDCAQAHGAEYKGKKAGTIGTLGCYSFYPSKNLGCYGDGGCVITNNEVLCDRLKMLRNYGQQDRYRQNIIGINSRLSEIQATILNVKLHYLDQWNMKRTRIAEEYIKSLNDYPITFQEFPKRQRKHVFHLMVLRNNKRDALIDYLSDNGIQILIHYPIPLYLQKAYRYLGIKKGTCVAAEDACRKVFSVPLYPYLKDKEMEIVINKIKEFFNGSFKRCYSCLF